MKIEHQTDGYWVTEIPECEPCGPYNTSAEAAETKRGLQRTFDNIDDPTFFTCEKLNGQNHKRESGPTSR